MQCPEIVVREFRLGGGGRGILGVPHFGSKNEGNMIVEAIK